MKPRHTSPVLLCALALVWPGCTDEARGPQGGLAPPLPTVDATSGDTDLTPQAPTPDCQGLADGVICDDGDLCTTEDLCSAGLCVGGVTRTCDDEGPCRIGTCDATLGCSYSDEEEGAPCGVACFGAAACEGGVCTADPDTEMVCPEPDAPCIAELRCHPSTGDCTQEIYSPSGSTCDLDGDLCTLDTCDGSGACASTGELQACVSASVEQPCWTHTCIPKDGTCAATLFIEGGSCNDNAPCTISDTCIITDFGQEACLGTPMDVDDGNPCTDDSCEGGVVLHEPLDGAACDTGDLCTPTGACSEGLCLYEGCPCTDNADCEQPADLCAPQMICSVDGGVSACVPDADTEVTCDAPSSPCHTNTCDPGTGLCEESALGNGSPCDDGDPCTTDNSCLAEVCVGAALPCDDGNPCTDDGCVGDGTCVHLPNTAPCAGGTCSEGTCGEGSGCDQVVYGSAGQGINNGWTCEDVCSDLGGLSVNWTGVDEQLAYCHSLVAEAEDIVVAPNNHSYPIYDRQNDAHMCKVNANGWKSTANWPGGGTPEYGDRILCRCQVTDCPCTPGCDGLSCGVDACGTSCGECPEDVSCVGGKCSGGSEVTGGLVYSDMITGGVYYWTQDGGSLQIGSCEQPWGLHFVPPDLVYAACIASDTVERLTLDGEQTTVHTSESAFFNARAITQGPTGAIYVASSTVTSTHVWEVQEASKTVTPFSNIGVMECGGIAFGEDGSLYWADFKTDGLVQRESPGGGIETVIPSFPGGYTLRDMQLGSDGLLYIVGATTTGGFRVHTQSGDLVESLDLPGNGQGFGVARGDDGSVFVLVEDASPAIYRRVGAGWELVTSVGTGLGTVRIIP